LGEKGGRRYGFYLTGYVVMPEHVHLLLSEPEHAKLSTGLQMLKQITAHHLMSYAPAGIFWQARYYDSTYGASARESRSYVTSIATQSNVDYARVPKIGSGAAFVIIFVGWKEWSKSSLSGRLEEESSLV
jgi:hypothetical protein